MNRNGCWCVSCKANEEVGTGVYVGGKRSGERDLRELRGNYKAGRKGRRAYYDRSREQIMNVTRGSG